MVSGVKVTGHELANLHRLAQVMRIHSLQGMHPRGCLGVSHKASSVMKDGVNVQTKAAVLPLLSCLVDPKSSTCFDEVEIGWPWCVSVASHNCQLYALLKSRSSCHDRSSDHYTDCLVDALRCAASRAQWPGAEQEREQDRKLQQKFKQPSRQQQQQQPLEKDSARHHKPSHTATNGEQASVDQGSAKQPASGHDSSHTHHQGDWGSIQAARNGSQSLQSQPGSQTIEDTPGPHQGQTGTHARQQGAATEHSRGDAADVGHNFGGHAPRDAGSVHRTGETELTSRPSDMQ